MTEPSTPLMRQYAAIKKEHPNALLFFRLGDFYELFFEDAVVAARELQITLTSRNKEKGIAIPMCGVPYHSAENYIAKLIRKGFKVAICEQMEDPRARQEAREARSHARAHAGHRGRLAARLGGEQLSGLRRPRRKRRWVSRRSICPLASFARPSFTATMPNAAYAKSCWCCARARCCSLRRCRCSISLGSHAGRSRPAAAPRMASLENATWAETPLDDWVFSPDYAIPQVENHFGVLSLEGFGLANRVGCRDRRGRDSALRSHHAARLARPRRPHRLLRAAELPGARRGHRSQPGTDRAAVFRRRRQRHAVPLPRLHGHSDGQAPAARLDAAALDRSWPRSISGSMPSTAWSKDVVAREELRRSMEGILDLERLLSRVTLETANPRDLLALATSLGKLPAVRAALSHFPAERLQALHAQCDELADLRTRIRLVAGRRAAAHLDDGGVIRGGVDAALDELRDLSRNSKQYIAQIEQRERQRTGIGSLKVKFNSVFGYYLEISKANLHLAPPDYERKQTLVNAERFTTPELKEYEGKVLDAQEKMVEIERRLFAELRAADCCRGPPHPADRAGAGGNRCARVVRVTCGESQLLPAAARRLSGDIEIVEGRHPVIEQHGDRRRLRPLRAQRPLPERHDAFRPGHHRAEHGRQVHLPAAGGADRADGADGLVRSGALGAAGAGRPHLHPHRRRRQPGARPLDLHGRDDRDRGHPEYRDAALADPAGRGRTRHGDL